ncbi:acyl carrier protein [Streptomyces sp. NPDC051639]|uniref:acyl carrier protein n=1 Tax=Streptomyces sp. NPDC051639 TaxID=3155671 RepID=UPI00342B1847
MTISEQLARILVDDLGISEDWIAPHTTLNDAGLDSLALAELAELLPERVGVHLGDDVLAKAATVGELSTMVERELAAAGQQR